MNASLKAPVDGARLRDLATEHGSYEILQLTTGGYLLKIGVDVSGGHFAIDHSLSVDFQRSPIPIAKNSVKRRMFRDMARGGAVPPVVAYDSGKDRWKIIDGLQRTDVAVEVAKALSALERSDAIAPYAQAELDEIQHLKQARLSLHEFLDRPFFVQVWRQLKADELVRLFMVLNVGQQKVSPRHLLEIIHANVRQMLEEWEIRLLTEKEEKLIPRKRGPHSVSEDSVIPTVTHFRFEYLVDGLKAYVAGEPHIKTSLVLEDAVKTDELVSRSLGERITELGSENCKADFQWVCRDLNNVIQGRYGAHPRWKVAIQNSDNFFIPLLAALGHARANFSNPSAIDDRQQKLIEIVSSSQDPDPLQFLDEEKGLEKLLNDVRSNIGRRRRAIVFLAWREFFRRGIEEPAYPVDWRSASVAV